MTDKLDEKEDFIFNPIRSYLIVNSELNMSPGKLSAQMAHAGQLLTKKYYQLKLSGLLTFELLNIFDQWDNADYGKIVLEADPKEWIKVKELSDHIVVIDNGLTQIAAGSETVIIFWPMYKSQAPKLIKRLRLLK